MFINAERSRRFDKETQRSPDEAYTMDNKVTFDMFKNIIIEQNKQLLKEVAKVTGKNEAVLVEKYIKPEFYLPIVLKTIEKSETKQPSPL